jgi:hypothetical protein
MLSPCNLRPVVAGADVAAIPGLYELWAETPGDPRICIAILDGPVDLDHACLAGAKLTTIETLAGGGVQPGTIAEHGTHVASVIFGRHPGPIKGIAPQCRGLIAPIFRDLSSGSPVPCSQVDLARVLLQVVQAGANIINISGGQFSPSGAAHPILEDAVRTCSRKGALIVAAAGNQGCDCLHIPGAMPSVLAVGAMNSRSEPLPFSNWGGAYRTQGILAPGEDILGAIPGNGFAANSGTSFATPIVAGVAALMLSLQIKRGQKPDATSVRDALLRGASACQVQQEGDCRRFLAGRLNIRRAISILNLGERNMTESTSHTIQHAAIAEPELTSSGDRIVPSIVEVGPTMTSNPSESSMVPSACGCAGPSSPQFVYALGQLGFTFASEARRDTFVQNMDEPADGITPNPHDARQMLGYLQENPWDAAALIWTLSLDGTPIYAIMPQGPFAAESYQRLRRFLEEHYTEGAERISIAGTMTGKARLLTGQVVPVIVPEIRGMCNWTTKALVAAVAGTQPGDSASEAEKSAHTKKTEGVAGFLEKVYNEMRNLGITPQERAMNFAGTNAFNIATVYESALKEEELMDLDSIEVERSPICRPESDCWDVKLHFFYPNRHVQTVRKV